MFDRFSGVAHLKEIESEGLPTPSVNQIEVQFVGMLYKAVF